MKSPDWSLLPNRPRLFFELTDDAGRQDLKRAYARLVKRFKPEAHPDEFMRIRAAYEEFERALAYGVEETPRETTPPMPAAAGAEPTPPPVAPTVVSGDTGSGLPARRDPPPPPLASLGPATLGPATTPPSPATTASTSTRAPRALSLRRPGSTPATPPRTVLSDFAQSLFTLATSEAANPPAPPIPKTAEDFIHLAFFREAVTGTAAGETLFFQTLLDGLKQFPKDRDLIEALRKFFTSLDDAALIPRCLEQARWWVPPVVFFYVTESAWFRFGQIVGGKAASTLLREFMKAETSEVSQTTFLLRFLRRHFDSIDLTWFGECLSLIHEQLADEGAEDSDELDFLTLVFEFIKMPEDLRERYPVLNEIRSILELVCRGEAEANLNRIYTFYRKLADLATTCELFAGPLSDLLPAYRLLVAIREEQLSTFDEVDLTRRKIALQPVNLAALIRDLQSAVGIANEEAPPPKPDWRDSVGGYLTLLVAAVAFFGTNQLLANVSWWLRIPAAAAAAVIAYTCTAALHRKAFPRRGTMPPGQKAWETYELRIRPHLVEYIKAGRLTSGELAISIDEADETIGAEYHKADLHGFLGKDMPLAFHSLGLLVMTH